MINPAQSFVGDPLWLLKRTTLPIGTLIGGGLGLVGSLISGRSARKAQQSANQSNLEATKLATEADYRKFLESRGKGGSAVLPLYFGNVESSLGDNLVNLFEEAGDRDPRYAPLAEGLFPALEAGNEFVGSLQTGDALRPRADINDRRDLAREEFISTQGDILGDRTGIREQALETLGGNVGDREGLRSDFLTSQEQNVAERSSARKAAINDSLQETLKELRSARHQQGLGGGSSFTDSLLTGATADARARNALANLAERDALNNARLNLGLATEADQDAVNNLALQLGLAGTQDREGLNNAGLNLALSGAGEDEALLNDIVNLRTQTLGLPFSRIEGLTNLDRLTASQAYAPVDDLLRRLNFFNLGQGQPPPERVFFREPVPGTGQFIGSAISQVGNTLGNYFQNKELLDAIKGRLNPPATPTAAVPSAAPSNNFLLPVTEFEQFNG